MIRSSGKIRGDSSAVAAVRQSLRNFRHENTAGRGFRIRLRISQSPAEEIQIQIPTIEVVVYSHLLPEVHIKLCESERKILDMKQQRFELSSLSYHMQNLVSQLSARVSFDVLLMLILINASSSVL